MKGAILLLCITLLISSCNSQQNFKVSRPRFAVAPSPISEREHDFVTRDVTGSSGDATSSSDASEDLHSAQEFNFYLENQSANYDYFSATYIVPSIPVNVSGADPNMGFQPSIYLSSANQDTTAPGDAVGVWAAFNGDPDHRLWSVSACVAPYYNFTCTDTVSVNAGDLVTVTIFLRNGVWTATATTSGGVNISISAQASTFVGPLGFAAIQWPQFDVHNCNNLPGTNHWDVNNIVIKDNGVQLTAFNWTQVFTPSACSFQSVANEISTRISWNSDNWVGTTDVCTLREMFFIRNSWVSGGQTFYEFNLEIDNEGSYPDQNITSLTFDLDPRPTQAPWGVQVNADGSYSIPSYSLPLGIFPYWNIYVGFIATQRPRLTNIRCVGGDHFFLIGEQPGHPYTGTQATLDVDNTGCSVDMQQHVTNTWSDGTHDFAQIDVVLRNSGLRTVTAVDFTPSQASSVSQAPWAVKDLGNHHYGLPSWTPTLAPSASISFGYIAKGAQAATFTTQVTCN